MRFIISFLLIIFLSSSTLVDARSLPVKTGTMLVCKHNFPHTYLIEFIDGSQHLTRNPRTLKWNKMGTYYKFGESLGHYNSNNDFIDLRPGRNLKDDSYWSLRIIRENLKFEVTGVYLEGKKCESVDKTTFDNEVEKLKKEIEERNKVIDEHYKRNNKI